jgi:hypothetical protein
MHSKLSPLKLTCGTCCFAGPTCHPSERDREERLGLLLLHAVGRAGERGLRLVSGEGVANGGDQGRHELQRALAHPRSCLAWPDAVHSAVATGAGDIDGGGPVAAVLGGAETDEDGRVAPGE